VKWRTGGSIGFAVVEAAEPRPSYRRLSIWLLLVAGLAVAGYSQRGTHSDTSVYRYSTFEGVLVQYVIWLGIVLLVAIDRFELLAFRAPREWGRALRLAGVAFVVIIACDAIVAYLPLPQSPGKEQGLTPTHWEPAHAGAFAANLVALAVVAPVVEELMFRGLGQSLLRFLGRVPAMVVVGVAFGVDHGLVEGLLVLIPFGIALAWLRDRTDSVLPGILVHAVFNGGTLALVVLTAAR
jgi:membrane protease YdiL (CAAX protease family)